MFVRYRSSPWGEWNESSGHQVFKLLLGIIVLKRNHLISVRTYYLQIQDYLECGDDLRERSIFGLLFLLPNSFRPSLPPFPYVFTQSSEATHWGRGEGKQTDEGTWHSVSACVSALWISSRLPDQMTHPILKHTSANPINRYSKCMHNDCHKGNNNPSDWLWDIIEACKSVRKLLNECSMPTKQRKTCHYDDT